MAQQLKHRGREVQLLVAIDYVPSISISNLARCRAIAAQLPRAIVQKELHIVARILTRWRRSENLCHSADRIVRNISQFEEYHQTFVRWLYDASRQYRLKDQYQGPVLVFQASQPALRSYPVREAWKKIAARPGLTIAVVPGGHCTMMEPPNVEILARHLIAKIAATAPPRNCCAPSDAKTARGRPSDWGDRIMKAIRI
jgi:thioesterase domain-containing protein